MTMVTEQATGQNGATLLTKKEIIEDIIQMVSDLEGIESAISIYEQMESMELWQLEEIQKHYETILYGVD